MTESITRILVPVDFSAHSEKAIRYATTLGHALRAQVTLLHVVQDPFVTGAGQAEAFVPNMPELLNEMLKTAYAQMAELEGRLLAQGFTVQSAVIKGVPAREIVEYARTGAFNLIVMGTHGRTGLSHALLGSIAERVVQKAPCAVLTVRETDPAALTRAVA
jgi:nucleotide-binding universal stress UspA family protein